MSETKRVKKKAAIPPKECVACGCCMKVCPRDAIRIYKGIYAQADSEKCVGCGKCVKECPASIITLVGV
ncbi:MAG: 4Fe-4S binding protein [Lachnospiraceae bacterium]